MINILTNIESTPIKVCFSIIFIIIFLLFFNAFFLGIINIGNIFGMIISALGFSIFAFNDKFSLLINHLTQRTFGKIVINIISIVTILCILLALVISIFMIVKMNSQPNEPSNIIVLGCKVKGTKPSLMLERRLNTAYEYLIENENVIAIVSGGQGSDEQISEAQCMNEYLISKGIDKNRIIMEDKSTSTYENFKFSKQILEERSLPIDNITVVTDGFHQLRASMIAETLDLNTYSVSAPTSWYLVPTYFVREWFGIVYQFFKSL